MFENRFIRLLKRLIQGFWEDDGYSRALALSYYTLLSIVPILAVAFGIAKGFGFERLLESQILETFSQQKEFAEKVIEFARSTLENAQGSLIAGVGVLLLFWSALGLLGNLELALNTIWKAPNMRPIVKRYIDYFPILILAPVFIIISSSFTFVIITKLVQFTESSGFYQTARPLIFLSYYILLTLVTWIFVSFIYIYIPNKKVPWTSCFFAALMAAFTFQVTQWAYIHLQVFLSSYNAIYGSFAAIPLFLIWLQLSWLILLAGAEIAYQHSVRGLFAATRAAKKMVIHQKELLLLGMVAICQGFENRKPIKGSLDLAHQLGISERLASFILRKCLDAKLIVETTDTVTLITDPDKIPISEVLENTDPQTQALYEVAKTPASMFVKDYLLTFLKDMHKIHTNKSLKTISLQCETYEKHDE